MIKRMGKFDWCAVIEKQWCNLWKRQNVLSLHASFLYEKLQLLKFNDIVKLQLAKTVHSIHNEKIANLYFGFSKVEKFHHYCTRNSIMSNFVQISTRTEKAT